MSRPTSDILEDIKIYMEARGLTQADLARKLGVDHAAVSRMFNASNITVARLARVCEALGARLTLSIGAQE